MEAKENSYRALGVNYRALPLASGSSSHSIETEGKEVGDESFEESSSERRAHNSKNWSLSNLVSSALEPLQSEESLKAVAEVEQENKREDTQARNSRQQRRMFLPSG